MSGLVSHLMRERGLSYNAALFLARKIAADKKIRSAQKKAKLEAQQMALPLDNKPPLKPLPPIRYDDEF